MALLSEHPWLVPLIILVYCILVIVGMVTNILIIIVILRRRSMRSATNHLLLNLACSDILLCICGIIVGPPAFFLQEWPFGDALCRLIPAATRMSVSVSTWTAMLLAVHRLMMVSQLNMRINPKFSCIINLGIWISAAIVMIPEVIHRREVQIGSLHSERIMACMINWPKLVHGQIYFMLLFIAQFVIPCIVIVVVAIGTVLIMRKPGWAASDAAVRGASEDGGDVSAMKATNQMLVILVIIYFICWLPSIIIQLALMFHTQGPILTDPFYYILIHILAMCSVSYNLTLYALMSKRFREAFKALMPCSNLSRTLPTSQESNTVPVEDDKL